MMKHQILIVISSELVVNKMMKYVYLTMHPYRRW